MNAAIIGTSKVAQIHLREILKKKFKTIYIATRNFNEAKKKISKFLNNRTTKITLVKMKDLIKLKFSFISICTPTILHHKNIFFLKNKKKTVFFIEKPLISYLALRKNFQKIYSKIFCLKLRIIVSYPMYYMASLFLNKFKINANNIRKINIHYHTRGNHKRLYIAEDLLPHALSFFYKIMKKKIKSLNLISAKTKYSLNKWSCNIRFNHLNLKIFFSQDSSYKKSSFFFKINNRKYVRKLVYKKDIPYSFITYKNNHKMLGNPMTMNLNRVLNYKNFNSLNKNNKELTNFIFSIQQKLLNNGIY